MGAGGGAAAAAIIAAHAKRVQDVVDAFRISGATAPERSRTFADLEVTHQREADELVKDGVLVAGRVAGTWYLNESGFIVRRERQLLSTGKALLFVALIMVALLLVTVFLVKGRP